MSDSALKIVYHSLFHSIMSFGTMFWGNSSHSNTIFKMQKRMIKIMMGCSNTDSCTDLFKKLKILPLKSQYIFSILISVVNNKNYFITNIESHNIYTTQKIIHTFLRQT
jgi:hypothetical protein